MKRRRKMRKLNLENLCSLVTTTRDLKNFTTGRETSKKLF